MRCFLALLAILTVSGCSFKTQRQRDAERERQLRDEHSAAFKVGEAAHELAKHAEKAADAAGRALEENARKANEGWKAKDREDREKARDNR